MLDESTCYIITSKVYLKYKDLYLITVAELPE